MCSSDLDLAPPPSASPGLDTEVPLASVEMKLPEAILDSLPQVAAGTDSAAAPPAQAPTPVPVPATPSAPATPAPAPVERRSSDGLVKEVTLPLNISRSELEGHRKLKIKITVDVNFLP